MTASEKKIMKSIEKNLEISERYNKGTASWGEKVHLYRPKCRESPHLNLNLNLSQGLATPENYSTQM